MRDFLKKHSDRERKSKIDIIINNVFDFFICWIDCLARILNNLIQAVRSSRAQESVSIRSQLLIKIIFIIGV